MTYLRRKSESFTRSGRTEPKVLICSQLALRVRIADGVVAVRYFGWDDPAAADLNRVKTDGSRRRSYSNPRFTTMYVYT